jgi:hypothetical protein
MPTLENLLRYAAIPLLAGIGIATVFAANEGTSAESGPVRCGVETVRQGNMLALEAKFVADTAVSGDYQLRLAASGAGGNSNINQGGYFSANAGEVVTLGRMTVNANSNINLDFTVSANGARFDCDRVEALR